MDAAIFWIELYISFSLNRLEITFFLSLEAIAAPWLSNIGDARQSLIGFQ